MTCEKLYLLYVYNLSLGISVVWDVIKATNISIPKLPPTPFIITIATIAVITTVTTDKWILTNIFQNSRKPKFLEFLTYYKR